MKFFYKRIAKPGEFNSKLCDLFITRWGAMVFEASKFKEYLLNYLNCK
jgi:hypothetical protein